MGIEEYLPKTEAETLAHERYERSFQIGERFVLDDGREWEVRGSTAKEKDGQSEIIVLYTTKIDRESKKRGRLELTAQELLKRIVDHPINHAA